jgi:hypothetical protein
MSRTCRTRGRWTVSPAESPGGHCHGTWHFSQPVRTAPGDRFRVRWAAGWRPAGPPPQHPPPIRPHVSPWGDRSVGPWGDCGPSVSTCTRSAPKRTGGQRDRRQEEVVARTPRIQARHGPGGGPTERRGSTFRCAGAGDSRSPVSSQAGRHPGNRAPQPSSDPGRHPPETDASTTTSPPSDSAADGPPWRAVCASGDGP